MSSNSSGNGDAWDNVRTGRRRGGCTKDAAARATDRPCSPSGRHPSASCTGYITGTPYAATTLLITQAKAYLANPSAGTLAQMQVQVVVLQQQVNTAMLRAARIVNPASQQHALAAIQAVGTVVTVMLSLVQSVSSKAAVAQMAAAATVKMSDVLPWVDEQQAAEMVAVHYGEPVVVAQIQVAQVERVETGAGF